MTRRQLKKDAAASIQAGRIGALERDLAVTRRQLKEKDAALSIQAGRISALERELKGDLAKTSDVVLSPAAAFPHSASGLAAVRPLTPRAQFL